MPPEGRSWPRRLIALAARDQRAGPDTGTAVAVTGLVGLGSLLALEPDAPQRLEELLFGDPLGVTDGDLAAAALLLALGGAALVALRRPLAATSFDPAGAAALRLRPGLVRLALLGLMAAAIAVAVQGLGALLVLAVLVAPALAVRRHTHTPEAAMGAGAAVAAAAGAAGHPAVRAGRHRCRCIGGARAVRRRGGRGGAARPA